MNVVLENNVFTFTTKTSVRTFELIGGIQAEIIEGKILFTRNDDSREQRALHGLNRALANNVVLGMTVGFKKSLQIIGTGYSAEVIGPWLKLALGYSHEILLQIPEGIKVDVEAVPRSKGTKNAIQNIVNIVGSDKDNVGKFSAEVRKCRKPENYKGKGVRYSDEKVIIKAGKAGAKK